MPLAPQAIEAKSPTDGGFAPFVFDAGDLAAARSHFERFGFAVMGPDATLPRFFADLRAESAQQRVRASWPLKTGDGRSHTSEDSVRGHLGPVARGLMASDATAQVMRAVTGEAVQPSWSASCYTWYDRPGAWLGRHGDKPDACFMTMIFGIESAWPGETPPPGNQLWVFENLKAPKPLYQLTTRPNRVTILDGKRWPHSRPTLGEGQNVSVLCGCFRQGEP